MNERIIPKNMAHQNPCTLNPGTNSSASSMIIALMARRNKPSVKSVTGSVSNIRNGFTSAFSSESTRASRTAESALSNSTPGSNHAVMSTASVVTISLEKMSCADLDNLISNDLFQQRYATWSGMR